MGICEVLIPLTNSPSSEVQGNSAAALGNLSSKGMHLLANHASSVTHVTPLQTAARLLTTIPHLTTFGTDLMAACTNTSIVS